MVNFGLVDIGIYLCCGYLPVFVAHLSLRSCASCHTKIEINIIYYYYTFYSIKQLVKTGIRLKNGYIALLYWDTELLIRTNDTHYYYQVISNVDTTYFLGSENSNSC